MKHIIRLSLLLLALMLIGCNGGPGGKQYLLANKAFAEGRYRTSFENYLYAANQGVVPAQYAVGYQYYYGLGTKMDESRGIMWLEKAAPKSPEAQYALNVIRQHQAKPPWILHLK